MLSSCHRPCTSTGSTRVFDRSCLVVAHPDDEVLWFSSILAHVDLVIICYMDNPTYPNRGAARRRVRDRYPLDNTVFLGLPVPDEDGYPAVDLLATLREWTQEFDNVFTHNLWGEYGHPAHVIMHKTVRALGKRMWFSNYVSNNSLDFASACFMHSVDHHMRQTNVALAHQIRDLYLEEGCWTAPRDFAWPESECFSRFPVVTDPLGGGKVPPLNRVYWCG